MNESIDSSDLFANFDPNAPFTSANRRDSTGGTSFQSVQTSFTNKGMGWECKSCAMLNELHCTTCQLCAGGRHVEDESQSIREEDHMTSSMIQPKVKLCDSNESIVPSKKVVDPTSPNMEYRKRVSTATGSSRSSRESKQSDWSKRSTLDPPAVASSSSAGAKDAPDAIGGGGGPTEKRKHRQANHTGHNRASRRASQTDAVGKEKKNGRKKKEVETNTTSTSSLSGPAAVAALSSTPLPGEATPQAIAQLLGLTRDMNIGNAADGSTVDNSNNSRSRGSSGTNVKSNSGEMNDETKGEQQQQHQQQQHQKQQHHQQQRRTTFSKDVQDIQNAIKLNKKIQGDREKADKFKAVKRGEVTEPQHHPSDANGKDQTSEVSELCAGAKPFLPNAQVEKVEEHTQNHDSNAQRLEAKKGGRCNKKKNHPMFRDCTIGGEDGKQQHHNGKAAEVMMDGKHGNKSKQNKGQRHPQQQQHQQNRIESATGVNLTLQAIQQSRHQKKGSATKHTKEKTDHSGHPTDNNRGEKERRKSQLKQIELVDENAKQTKPTSKKATKSLTKEETNPKSKSSATNPSSNAPALPPNQPQTTNDLNYGAGRPIVVVHIAEKPSIAQAIAHGLNRGGAKKSVGKSLPTHEFVDPPFLKAPKASKVTHRVSSVAGHVFNVDFPAEYQSWDTVDPAELFHAPLVKKPCKGSVVKHLQDIAKGSDFIVLWMDCDREGENINFEVLDCCMHLMQGSGQFDRVYRAHFSAINPSDITKAYNELGKPDRNQSLSVDARQELDLKVGVAFSRFQTRYFQGRYGDLDSAVLSYGPCQTPTLGFCVQRHLDIETFKREPYWTLDLGIMNTGTMCRAVWDSGRSFNRNKVEEMIATCRNTPSASVKVLSLVAKEKKQGRPLPLNTVALLKACSKALGIGPHAALSIAERLYLSGYLSYPRTESTKYPSSFDIKGSLQSQTNDSRWGQYVTDLLKKGANLGKGGVDMGDHPPITPCRYSRAGELSGDTARVYDLVARHFIASVSEDAVWKSTTVCLAIEELGEKGTFTIRGKQMVTPGFLAIVLYKQYGDDPEEGHEDDEEEKILPEFEVGDHFGLTFPAYAKFDKVSVVPGGGGKCATLDIKEKMTTPPTYLTESELISKMEHNGIGTDASISTHIENILKRNYVELIPGRKLKPSRLGLVLAQGYHLIDDSLVLPRIRSDIEDQCIKIAKGLAERDAVVKRAIGIFSTKFHNFVENISKMDVLFSSSFAQLQDVGKPFTRCGFTRRYLQFIAGPPPRLYNKITESVYPLPIGGVIKQWTGRNCPVDGCNFELCLYSVGAPPRTFPLCPNCFNNPKPEWGPVPGENTVPNGADADDEANERKIRSLVGKNMIRECPHPDGHPLIAEMTVCPDPESDGVLILDPHLGPKWRLVSTRQPTIVHLPKSVEKITILDKKDEVFGCHMMFIEFKAGESPIEGKGKYTSCFANDETLQGLVRVYHGDEKSKSSSNWKGKSGRGRGTGRGRGGGRGGQRQR